MTLPDDVVARIDAQRRLLEVLLALPEPCRSALFHLHVEGLPRDEIARRLGVAEDTVRSRLRCALRLLRVRLR
jgi:RNA polymerase sigma factor (sigma-70 family)